ncbi:ABC transporter permease [Nitriliruptoraceae bacterium ZYF776]|nr:ABC transporter permease [Profundirhabdus halotolerans]
MSTDDRTPMSAGRTVRLVAERELLDRLTNRAFVGGTLFMVLALVAIIVLPTVFGGDDDDRSRLGIVGEAPAGFEETVAGIAASQDAEVILVDVLDRGAGEAALEDGAIDAMLVVDDEQLVTAGDAPGQLLAAVEAGYQQAGLLGELEAAGVDPAQLAEVMAGGAQLQVVDLDGEEAADDGQGTDFLFAMLATVLLFLIVQLNASSLMTVALEEKSSRVVELLVATARPWQLLAGKVLAMTALAIAQFALFVGAGLAANAAVGATEVPGAATEIILVGLTMLIVGFLFYATLFTVAGSMATSIEDSQSTSTPLITGLVGAYALVFIVVLPNPDSFGATLLTFLPPTAPFVVPARLALGELPWWQFGAATVITAVAAYGAIRLAGRLYASVLLAGNKLSWRDAWRAEPVR